MKKIKANELETLMGKNPNLFVINALSAEEFANQHIPRSFNIPANAPDFLQQVAKKVSDKKAPVVVYCSASDCDASKNAGRTLEKAGYTNVLHFEGGMEEWLAAGKRAESKKRKAA